MDQPIAHGVRLVHAGERVEEVEALARQLGGRVPLVGLLQDLNRSARVTDVPGRAAVWGFRWNDEDTRTQQWFPQGITTSADRGDPEDIDGRRVLCTSWYSSKLSGPQKGARVTFVDLDAEGGPRYRHVLLVEPVVGQDGRVDVVPVPLHAGGLVWHGSYLHVAGTARGIYSFRLDDLMRVPPGGDRDRLKVHEDGRVDGFGYRYVLPLRFTYDGVADDGHEKLRYSFLSIDRSARPHRLVAGEYGRHDMTTRLVSFELDAETSLLQTDAARFAQPVSTHDGGVGAMQGAAVVDGRFYVTTSDGRHGRGSLWTGTPGKLRQHARVLPVGPEDITYWPSTDQLWSLTEYPGRRYVFAMNRADFD